MAVPQQRILPVPLPDETEVAALRTVGAYLTRAGTQAASLLLGCPPPDAEAGMVADFSNSLLGSAALVEGLLALAAERGCVLVGRGTVADTLR